jgi:DNA end-binding protein Ku
MASTVWKGHLTFGLVSIPVRLIRAARAQRVSLRQLYRPRETAVAPPTPSIPTIPEKATGRPIATNARQAEERSEPAVMPVHRTYQAGNADAEVEPIEPPDLVKGYEYAKGQYAVLDEQDLRELAPPTATEMQIVEFVRFAEIDPVYLETSYYLVPDESGEKAYALLFDSMRSTGFAAIGHLTMHRRDHVIILRTGKSGLIAHTMYYPDEVRSTEEFRTDTKLVAAKESELAKSLIEALAKSFDPTQFKNAFRERLQQLIESKIEGREVAHVEPAAGKTKVVDIMDALRRSLEEAKASRKPASAEPSRKKRQTKAR